MINEVQQLNRQTIECDQNGLLLKGFVLQIFLHKYRKFLLTFRLFGKTITFKSKLLWLLFGQLREKLCYVLVLYLVTLQTIEWVSREKTVLKECSLAILISALISRCGTIYTSKHHTKFEWERSILLQEATLLKKFQKVCFTTIVVGHQLTDWMDWVQIPLMLLWNNYNECREWLRQCIEGCTLYLADAF